jgi:5'-deoxynucleotidase YfbR-like HD superfamily hydrolase
LKSRGFLRSTDLEFIYTKDREYPDRGIRKKFDKYSALHPSARPNQSRVDIYMLPRGGPQRLNFPQDLLQTVGQHQDALEVMVDYIARTHNIGVNIRRARRIVRKHDVPEVIASDFTVADKISKADKSRLEELAARTIFRASARDYRIWKEYEEGRTRVSKLDHEADKLECVTFALFAQEKRPELKTVIGEEFWNTANDYIKMPAIRREYDLLVKARKELEETGRTPTCSPLYLLMKKNYHSHGLGLGLSDQMESGRHDSTPPPPLRQAS